MVLWKVCGEGCRRQHNGLPRLRFAQVVAKTQVIATRLFVGFSDDGRVLVPVLVLFFVFLSSSSSLGSRGGIALPPMMVTRLQMLSGMRGVMIGSCVDVATFMTMLARAFAPGKASALPSFTRTACSRGLIGASRGTTVCKPDSPSLPTTLA